MPRSAKALTKSCRRPFQSSEHFIPLTSTLAFARSHAWSTIAGAKYRQLRKQSRPIDRPKEIPSGKSILMAFMVFVAPRRSVAIPSLRFTPPPPPGSRDEKDRLANHQYRSLCCSRVLLRSASVSCGRMCKGSECSRTRRRAPDRRDAA